MSLQGSVTGAQQEHLRALAASMGRVAEIGFNEGISAAALLSANPCVRVVSFELADHDGLHLAKHRLDAQVPGRHQLVTGDSRVTVPAWDGPPFDLMFVDGGHEYETAAADLANSLAVVRPGGLIVCDDLTPWKPWGKGPSRAWEEFVSAGRVVQVDVRSDGGNRDMRIWAVGHVPLA